MAAIQRPSPRRSTSSRLGLDQRPGLGLLAAPDGQRDGAAQGQVAAGRLHDGVRLGGERHGRREPAAEEVGVDLVVQGDGQQRQRAGPAGELDLARGELVPGRVVAEGPGDVAGQPEPAQLLLLGQRFVPERAAARPSAPAPRRRSPRS